MGARVCCQERPPQGGPLGCCAGPEDEVWPLYASGSRGPQLTPELHTNLAACAQQDGVLDAEELRLALGYSGLSPDDALLQQGLEANALEAGAVDFQDFPVLAAHLRRVGCASCPQSVPHARRGMRLSQLQAAKTAFVDSGWLKSVAGMASFMRDNIYALNEYAILPITSGEAAQRQKIPEVRLQEAGVVLAELRPCSYSQLVNPRGLQADFFVSHYWGQSFAATLGALQLYAADRQQDLGRESPQDVVFWMCVFAMSQNEHEDIGPSPALGPFRWALQKATAGAVLVVDGEWETLRRAWCLYEVMCAYDVGQPLELMTDRGHPMPTEWLCSNLRAISGCDAFATNEDDRTAIWFEVVNPDWGKEVFADLDSFRDCALGAEGEAGPLGPEHFTCFDQQLRSLLATPLLLTALERGNTKAALQCIGLGAYVRVEDLHRFKGLGGDLFGALECIIGGSDDGKATPADGTATLTYMMAQAGNVEALRYLLDERGDPEAKAQLGSPAAAPGLRGLDQSSALHAAAWAGRLDSVALLLEYQASVEAQSLLGWSPLDCACNTNEESADIAALLVEKESHPMWEHGEKRATVFHSVAGLGNEAVLAVLLETHGYEDHGQTDGTTPLHRAAMCGHVEVATLLLRWHANPCATKGDGVTPLHLAAKFGSASVVTLLRESRADAAAQDAQGRTPAALAESGGHEEVLDLLALPDTDFPDWDDPADDEQTVEDPAPAEAPAKEGPGALPEASDGKPTTPGSSGQENAADGSSDDDKVAWI